MATNKDFVDYVLTQLSNLDSIRTKQMMGEYLVYYKDKLPAYICDNNLLIKATKGCREILPEAELVYPYEGAKNKMLLVENIDNKELLEVLFKTAYKEI